MVKSISTCKFYCFCHSENGTWCPEMNRRNMASSFSKKTRPNGRPSPLLLVWRKRRFAGHLAWQNKSNIFEILFFGCLWLDVRWRLFIDAALTLVKVAILLVACKISLIDRNSCNGQPKETHVEVHIWTSVSILDFVFESERSASWYLLIPYQFSLSSVTSFPDSSSSCSFELHETWRPAPFV